MKAPSLSRRLIALAGALVIGFSMATPASADDQRLKFGEPSVTTEVNPSKINVMGLWAHPDDDASFITPCGVWHDQRSES